MCLIASSLHLVVTCVVGFVQFAGMTKLKKAAFMVVARCLSSEEIKGLRELFKTIDANNDGTITVDELKVSHA